ncbi:MAG: 50S ribosomal protein L11 methyltransferase [Chlamydiia bacterium]|nr:50S ribosomal protein L11 methyltransferase [Chlamydiia bacterium]
MHYQFLLKNAELLDQAMHELQSLALHSLYTIEDDRIIIGGLGNLAGLPKLSSLINEGPETIDWHAQWAAFAPNFDGQHAHFPVGDQTIKLIPGPGFGDLSHPTTQLMAKAMQATDLGQCILDIGCGSGVLDCIAVHCNVKRFYIVDIDPEALDHAKRNMQLNAPHIQPIYSTTIDPSWRDIETILINMILPEQQVVFESYPFLKSFTGTWLTSGLLANQLDDYLRLTQAQPIQIWDQDGWIALHWQKTI